MSTTHFYIAIRLDGSTTRHANLKALAAAQRRARGARTIIDYWPEGDGPPADQNDVQAWDSWRLRRGIAAR